MVSEAHREEVVLRLLETTGVPLDPESVAATYHRPVTEWRSAFEQLVDDGEIEAVGDGLYRPRSVEPAGADPARTRTYPVGQWPSVARKNGR